MPLHLPTVSSLQRATACDASVALEQVEQGPPSPSAKRGSLIGAVIASDLRGWPKPDVGKHRLKINMVALRGYLGGEGEILCEAAMSLKPSGEVEYLGENIGREYNRPGCINGAADIVVVRRNLLCLDVKSGNYPVPDPEENWQVASLSAMAPLAFTGVESVTGVVAKIGRDGEWDFGKPHTWTLSELAGVRARLLRKLVTWREAALLADAGFAPPEKNAGPHCFFCMAVCEHGRNKPQESEAA